MCMTDILFWLTLAFMFATLGTLLAGLVVMASGPEANKAYANRLMSLRVLLQGITLLLFALTMMSSAA